MRKFFAFLFLLAISLPMFAQNLELVDSLRLTNRVVQVAKCPKYKARNGEMKPRVAIDISIPGVKFNVKSTFIASEHIDASQMGFTRVWIPVPEVKAITLSIEAEDHLPFKYVVSPGKVMGSKVYSLVFKGNLKPISVVGYNTTQNDFSTSNLSMTLDVADCYVRIDDEDSVKISGTSFNKIVRNGDHRIKISKPGYKPHDFNVQVMSDNKSDLILKIDEMGCDVYIDDAHTFLEGNNLISRLPNGNHHVRVAKANHEDYVFDVNLEGSSVFKEIKLKNLGGNLTVYVKNGYHGSTITLTHDSIPKKSKIGSFQILDSKPVENLLGKYRLRIQDADTSYKKRLRHKNRTIEISLGDTIERKYHFSKIQEGFALIGFDYCNAYKTASVQIGGLRRYGFMLDFGMSVDPFAGSNPLKGIKPLPEHYNPESSLYEDEGTYRMFGHAIVLWRWTQWAGIYAGAGYGCKTQIYLDYSTKYHDEVHKGPEAIGGVFLKAGPAPVSFKVSYVQNFGDVKFGALNLGVMFGGVRR